MAPTPVTFDFWNGQTARIAARPTPAKHAYIAWYGTLTGDVWHVAAAQILSEYAKANVAHPFQSHAIRACLTIMRYDKRKVPGGNPNVTHPVAPQPAVAQAPAQDTDQDREFLYGEEEELRNQGPEAPCVSRGRKSWRYLKSIGLGASLVMVPDRMGQTAVAYANNTLSTAQADRWYDDQDSTFDELMADRVNAITTATDWPGGTGPARDPGLIDLLASTSVVMQMMQHLGRAEAQKILGYRLSGGARLTPGAQDLAHRKVNALCAIIDGANKASGGKLAGVVLFNYRVGDVNKQHNANPTILSDVCTAAKDQNLVTIVIPQMASSVYARHKDGIKRQTKYVFDLLDVDSGSTEFMDDTAKAYFWHLVASFLQGRNSPLGTPTGSPPPAVATLSTPGRPKVVGLVGGRSGSTDLPGFVGLRVYSWEEPMLAALEGRSGPTNSGAWTSKYYEIQGPQAVRLFNQYPVVVTGFLNLDDFKKTGSVREYLHIDVDGALKKWLAGEDSIPTLPSTANKTFLQNFFKTNKAKIEKKPANGGVQVEAVSLGGWESAVAAHKPIAASAGGGGPIRKPPSRQNSSTGPYARQGTSSRQTSQSSLTGRSQSRQNSQSSLTGTSQSRQNSQSSLTGRSQSSLNRSASSLVHAMAATTLSGDGDVQMRSRSSSPVSSSSTSRQGSAGNINLNKDRKG